MVGSIQFEEKSKAAPYQNEQISSFFWISDAGFLQIWRKIKGSNPYQNEQISLFFWIDLSGKGTAFDFGSIFDKLGIWNPRNQDVNS